MPTKHLPHIACCLTRPDTQRALLAAIGSDASVSFLSDRRTVPLTAAQHGSVLVLAEVVDALGSRLSSLLIRQWQDTLAIPVVGVVRPVPEEVCLITDTVRWGVDDIFIVGIDNVAGRIGQLLREREAVASRTMREMLMGAVDADTIALIEACVREIGQVSAHGLARSAGVSERTLTRHFAILGLPAPGTVLRWVRTLLALQELRNPHRSVAQAAKHVGYSSHTAFRSTLRQLTGMSPTEARNPQGYQRALTAFDAMLRRSRRERPAPLRVRVS